MLKLWKRSSIIEQSIIFRRKWNEIFNFQNVGYHRDSNSYAYDLYG